MVVSKNILLVDDHKPFLTTLARELGNYSTDFRILTAENGEAALKVLESAPADLVVTDLRMPVMDGFALLSHLKKNYPSVPVIVLSSFLEPEVETWLKTLGVSQSIKKESLSVSVLGEMIRKNW